MGRAYLVEAADLEKRHEAEAAALRERFGVTEHETVFNENYPDGERLVAGGRCYYLRKGSVTELRHATEAELAAEVEKAERLLEDRRRYRAELEQKAAAGDELARVRLEHLVRREAQAREHYEDMNCFLFGLRGLPAR